MKKNSLPAGDISPIFQGIVQTNQPVFSSEVLKSLKTKGELISEAEKAARDAEKKILELQARLRDLEDENDRFRSQCYALEQAGTSAENLISEVVALRKGYDSVEPCPGCVIDEPVTWLDGTKMHSGDKTNGGVSIRCKYSRLTYLENALSQVQWMPLPAEDQDGHETTILACPWCRASKTHDDETHNADCHIARACGWKRKSPVASIVYGGIPFIPSQNLMRSQIYLADLQNMYTNISGQHQGGLPKNAYTRVAEKLMDAFSKKGK